MSRYIEGRDRSQTFLLPESIDDYIDEDNPVRAVEAFVNALDLVQLGFGRAVPADTGRPSYHPSTMLKIYLYGYLNRIQSSRRLEGIVNLTVRGRVWAGSWDHGAIMLRFGRTSPWSRS